MFVVFQDKWSFLIILISEDSFTVFQKLLNSRNYISIIISYDTYGMTDIPDATMYFTWCMESCQESPNISKDKICGKQVFQSRVRYTCTTGAHLKFSLVNAKKAPPFIHVRYFRPQSVQSNVRSTRISMPKQNVYTHVIAGIESNFYTLSQVHICAGQGHTTVPLVPCNLLLCRALP